MAKLRRLPVIKSILALALALAPLWKPLYGLVEALHNADFILGIRENPRMKWVWEFLTSQAGSFLVMLIGLAWLAYLILRKTKDQPGGEKQAALLSAETPAASDKEKEIRNDYRSRMDKDRWLSEVIARCDQLVRVFKGRGLIPREHIDIWIVDIREALSNCYGRSGISKFYRDETARTIKPIPSEQKEDLSDWVDFHQRRLAELLFEERHTNEPDIGSG